MEIKPLVGVSQCLLGDAVRYDGRSKANQIVLDKLNDIFELVPVCPEVEAGLGVPRPPVELTGDITNPRLTGRDDKTLDVTAVMVEYCLNKPSDLSQLAGFIFKSRSPSCGLNSTPVFINNECVTEQSRGVFARAVVNKFPSLAVIEDDDFCELSLNNFIKQVLQHANN